MQIGGGGRLHLPPNAIVVGRVTKLNIGFAIWGEGLDKPSLRFTNVKLNYKNTDEVEFSRTEAIYTHVDEDDFAWFEAALPEFDSATQSVDYFFEYTFDGRHQSDDIFTVPVMESITLEREVKEDPTKLENEK